MKRKSSEKKSKEIVETEQVAAAQEEKKVDVNEVVAEAETKKTKKPRKSKKEKSSKSKKDGDDAVIAESAAEASKEGEISQSEAAAGSTQANPSAEKSEDKGSAVVRMDIESETKVSEPAFGEIDFDDSFTKVLEEEYNFNKDADYKVLKSSDFVNIRGKLLITLPPLLLQKPDQGVYETLNGMLLKYIPQLSGVLVSFSQVRYESSFGKLMYDYPYLLFEVSAEFLVWRPLRGLRLRGVVNIQSQSHIGILVYNIFNASIPRKNIDKAKYMWVEFEEPIIEEVAADSEENQLASNKDIAGQIAADMAEMENKSKEKSNEEEISKEDDSSKVEEKADGSDDSDESSEEEESGEGKGSDEKGEGSEEKEEGSEEKTEESEEKAEGSEEKGATATDGENHSKMRSIKHTGQWVNILTNEPVGSEGYIDFIVSDVYRVNDVIGISGLMAWDD
ncbi:DNA-directed RNA polymerase I subunit RPA43 [Smittium culicis]|uniref:DNA-directed RNA polymerase I subunit RPA43 n=1 Tax=Smittium culicis TaxID=133412 RepID=A0A1R1X335_9FUNG|nr:DNA-directed RNA polymerase I subunit RPA43 [Smittium culicis]